MALEIALGRGDGLLVEPALVIGVSLHDQAPAGPFGKGILPVQAAEFLRRALVVALLDPGEAVVVDLLGRNVGDDLRLVGLALVERVERPPGARGQQRP
jgi:hypothetical protein